MKSNDGGGGGGGRGWGGGGEVFGQIVRHPNYIIFGENFGKITNFCILKTNIFLLF